MMIIFGVVGAVYIAGVVVVFSMLKMFSVDDVGILGPLYVGLRWPLIAIRAFIGK